MKTLSQSILFVIALAVHLPDLHGAPGSSNTLAISQELLKRAKEMHYLQLRNERKEEVYFQQIPGDGNGFVNDGCRFLEANPVLQNVQSYKSQFDITVSCKWDSTKRKPCTNIDMRRDRFPYDLVYVEICDFSAPYVPGGLCRYSNSKRLQKGRNIDKQGSTHYQIEIPIGDTDKIVLADVHYKVNRFSGLVYLDVANFRMEADGEPLEEC